MTRKTSAAGSLVFLLSLDDRTRARAGHEEARPVSTRPAATLNPSRTRRALTVLLLPRPPRQPLERFAVPFCGGMEIIVPLPRRVSPATHPFPPRAAREFFVNNAAPVKLPGTFIATLRNAGPEQISRNRSEVW